jgi:formylglycine-generating enzyme required for sulfatase activity/predicted Ser/Thr protein kinase
MDKPPICPKCGAHLPEDAPAGLCPNCLIRAGFESGDQAKPQIAPTAPSPASSRFEPPSVEELAGRFPNLEILELLGIGGMGAVYKARQKELDRMVAVKILPHEVSADPAFAERFTREARAMARLNYPNIVAVYDFGRTAKLPSPSERGTGRAGVGAEGSDLPLFYFIMEYVDGVNLRQAIQSGHMDPKQALAIVPQICDALQFAHDEGVVHRDIKPENILIDKRGRVKIADFGLAKLLGHESVDHGLTATQQVMGTLRYMAPEQMEGSKTVDHRADIYSLGVVFYELLTGELPIGRFAPPSKMVEIDVRLDEVVLRALEKKPEQRYQHASEVKTDMESIAGSPATAPAAASAGAAGSASGRTLLLDETDRAARKTQHVLMLLGLVSILLAVFYTLPILPGLWPLSILFWLFGIPLMIFAGRIRQQWEFDYLGHSIRFENSVYTSGRLMIDGKTMAAGGIKWIHTEISARVPRGTGAGDRIIVKTNPDFLSFRCRVFVEPKAAAAPKPVTAPEGSHLADSPAGPTKARMVLQLGLGAISAAAVLAAGWLWLYRPWPTTPTTLETRIIGQWDGQGETFGRAKVDGQQWQSWTQCKESVTATFKSDGTYTWWQHTEFAAAGNTSSSKTTLSLPKPGDPPAYWKVVGGEGSNGEGVKLYVKLDDGPHVMEGGFEFHGEDEFTMKLPESESARGGYTFHRRSQFVSWQDNIVQEVVFVLGFFVFVFSVAAMLVALVSLLRRPANRQPHTELAASETPSSPIGRISLWMAVSGLIVPTLLALIRAEPANSMLPPKNYFLLCLALLFVSELAAFICGIVGRRTASGKAGIAVSAISLVLAGLLVMSIDRWIVQPSMTGVKNAPPTVQETAVPRQSRQAVAAQPKTTSLPPKELTVDLGSDVKLELVLIPAGEFLMGSPDSDNDATHFEKPQHRVRITKPFYLGKCPVTQEQWDAVMGSNTSSFKGPKNPVETVSSDDCQQFLGKLNAKSAAGGGKFQLPTEAQWEYACRAGSKTKYCFGDDTSKLGEYAWYEANSGGKTHPVGEKKPNAWGLYDMHGNVWEWCQDWFDVGYYAKSPVDDPTGAAGGSSRVGRGGCWGYPAERCRSAHRDGGLPGFRHSYLGLRVALVPANK